MQAIDLSNLDAETRQYWEERFGQFQQQTTALAADVQSQHLASDAAVAEKSQSIVAEAAEIDMKRRVHERMMGVDGPVDLEFAEISALRKLRREEQARRLAKESLKAGREGCPGAWRELELRGRDSRFRHVGPDGGEHALELRLQKLEGLRAQHAEFNQSNLRTVAEEARLLAELDVGRERKSAQRWLNQLEPQHWNRRSCEPEHARQLHKSNYRAVDAVRHMQSARQLHAGVGLTKHYDAVSDKMTSHGSYVQSYMRNEIAFDSGIKTTMLDVTPLAQ
eukprot:TRINITY_DN50975_c0_g1_i2.p1 TRINITY_DN50975_c0_g1~~TRINITY_DN50975_c0_g1_i2.p1  ORF type:complete len:279 (+),score=70.07 TRINITY_DN50975_c0_g1_i2:1-837(+)